MQADLTSHVKSKQNTNEMDTETLELLSETPTKIKIPTSPIAPDTPNRRNELITNTLDISPIKVVSKPNLFDSEHSTSTTDTRKSPSPLVSEQQQAGSSNISETNQRSLRMVSNAAPTPKVKQPIIKPYNTAPKTHRIVKKPDEVVQLEDVEVAPKNLLLEKDILKFVKDLPSPLASPRTSISKRRDPDLREEGLSPPRKKRVNFSDPPTTEKVYFKDKNEHKKDDHKELTCDEVVASIQAVGLLTSSTNTDDPPLAEPLESLEPPLHDVVTSTKNSEPVETESLGMETQVSIDTTDPYYLEHHQPILPEFIHCKDSIDSILGRLVNPLFCFTLANELEKKRVFTIGDLAKLSEIDITRLPFRTPKVLSVRSAIRKFMAQKSPESKPEESKEIIEENHVNKEEESQPSNDSSLLLTPKSNRSRVNIVSSIIVQAARSVTSTPNSTKVDRSPRRVPLINVTSLNNTPSCSTFMQAAQPIEIDLSSSKESDCSETVVLENVDEKEKLRTRAPQIIADFEQMRENVKRQEATPDSIKSILERNLVSKNSKYSPELRSFALTLHFYSPKAYEYIRTSYNDLLPHPGTLQKWYQTMDGKPGFTLEAFEALALKVKEKEVIVNIAIDEMSIREQVQWDGNKYHGFVDLGTGLFSDSENTPKAKSVLVFMAVAVNSHWKVPLGYFLIKSLNASERKHLLEQCLSMLDKIAVDCRSITFDGAPVNIAMCNSLGSSFNLDDFRPWFCHPVSKKKVYTFWDPCHMLKLCRNALGHKKIFYTANGHQIHWKYLEQLAEEQNNRGLHLANKLTKRHINFQNEKMNVKLAAQTLSCSVSSALLFCKELGLPGFKYVDATAEFCCTINNIFDMLNSRNFLAKYIYKRPLSAKNLEFFSNACTSYIEYLRNLKGSDGILLIDSSRKVGFLGLIVCLENINCLYRDLITDTNIKFLLSYKLSQDHLEMFFSAVRSRGGYNNNPSAIQFSRAYKKLLVRHQISASKHSNCQILDATSILHVSSGSKKCIDDITNQTSEEISDEITLMLLNNDFNYFLPTLTEYDDNIITYIAGFVIKKIKTKIECNICSEQLYSNGDDLRLSNYTFVKLKNRGRLVMPSYDVV